MCVCLVVSNSAISWAVVLHAPLSMDSPGKNTGVGSIPFSRGSSLPRDQTLVSCIEGRFLPSEPPGKPIYIYIYIHTYIYEMEYY